MFLRTQKTLLRWRPLSTPPARSISGSGGGDAELWVWALTLPLCADWDVIACYYTACMRASVGTVAASVVSEKSDLYQFVLPRTYIPFVLHGLKVHV